MMAPNNYLGWTYLVYLALSLALTIWVAHTLHRNGRIFLVDAFHGREALADSVNHLLVVGFYLVNIGYAAVTLKATTRPYDLATVIELLSAKIGVVLLVLGGMHFMNMLVFSRMRRRGLKGYVPPPAAPEGRTPVGA